MRQLKITKTITNRSDASLDRYLAEISKTEMITAEEEAVLARRIREGDQEALRRLATANLRFVVSVAKQYQHQGLSLSDLINEGNLGLMKAAERFDETRGFKFISYAVWWIRQSIMQAVAEKSRVIRLPLNKTGTISKIKKAQSKFEQEYERSPSVQELAEMIPVSESEIASALNASSHHLSTDATVDSDSTMTLGDLIADKHALIPDEGLMHESRKSDVDAALSTLSSMERDIVCMFFGIGLKHALSLEEIGAKFEIGRERVRQIKEKALRKLRYGSGIHTLKAHLNM
jgi:RNA polymerase primary sigma factor